MATWPAESESVTDGGAECGTTGRNVCVDCGGSDGWVATIVCLDPKRRNLDEKSPASTKIGVWWLALAVTSVRQRGR